MLCWGMGGCRWFDKAEDDGAIERDLLPSSSVGKDAVNWKMTVITCERGEERRAIMPSCHNVVMGWCDSGG